MERTKSVRVRFENRKVCDYTNIKSLNGMRCRMENYSVTEEDTFTPHGNDQNWDLNYNPFNTYDTTYNPNQDVITVLNPLYIVDALQEGFRRNPRDMQSRRTVVNDNPGVRLRDLPLVPDQNIRTLMDEPINFTSNDPETQKLQRQLARAREAAELSTIPNFNEDTIRSLERQIESRLNPRPINVNNLPGPTIARGPATIEDFLTGLGLERHAAILRSEGFDHVPSIGNYDRNERMEMREALTTRGVPVDDVNRIIREANNEVSGRTTTSIEDLLTGLGLERHAAILRSEGFDYVPTIGNYDRNE